MLAEGIASRGNREVSRWWSSLRISQSKAVGYLTPSAVVMVSVFLCSTAVAAAMVYKRLRGGDSHSGKYESWFEVSVCVEVM